MISDAQIGRLYSLGVASAAPPSADGRDRGVATEALDRGPILESHRAPAWFSNLILCSTVSPPSQPIRPRSISKKEMK